MGMRADLFDVGLVFVIVDLSLATSIYQSLTNLRHVVIQSHEKNRDTLTDAYTDTENKYTVKVHSLSKCSLREANLSSKHIHRTSRQENRLLPLHVSLFLPSFFRTSHHVNVFLTPPSLYVWLRLSRLCVSCEWMHHSVICSIAIHRICFTRVHKEKQLIFKNTTHAREEKKEKLLQTLTTGKGFLTLILQTDTCSPSGNSISGTWTPIQETEPDTGRKTAQSLTWTRNSFWTD